MSDEVRVATGIPPLDRKLEGGLPTGSLVVLSAKPDSQAEVLLRTLSNGSRKNNRETIYMTTEQTKRGVREAYSRGSDNISSPKTIHRIDLESPLESTDELTQKIPENSLVVIDAVNILEVKSGKEYRKTLNKLHTCMSNTGSIAFLFALSGQDIPHNRDITYRLADVVFKLETYVERDELINRLSVPKFRGGVPVEDTISINISQDIEVDTSRDIA